MRISPGQMAVGEREAKTIQLDWRRWHDGSVLLHEVRPARLMIQQHHRQHNEPHDGCQDPHRNGGRNIGKAETEYS